MRRASPLDGLLVGGRGQIRGLFVLDHAEVGSDCMVGAGAVVTPRTVIPARSLVMGVPARVVRELTEPEVESIRRNAENYVRYSQIYRGIEDSSPVKLRVMGGAYARGAMLASATSRARSRSLRCCAFSSLMVTPV